MAETPEQLHKRAASALRNPPVEEWDTWPFRGPVTPRTLQPPLEAEPSRRGEDGVDCEECTALDSDYLWTNQRWRLWTFPEPSGLPAMVLLLPREHYQEPGDLSDELAAELGVLIARMDRAVRSIGEIGRVHVGRWGEGGAHLHWWFMARPARMGQLRSSMAAIWDDVLPPIPEDIWQANLDQIVRALSAPD